MVIFKYITFLLIFLSSPVIAVEAPSQNHTSSREFRPVIGKLEARATQNIRVKKLKRLLDQKKITTEQFFTKIEKTLHDPFAD